MTRRLVILVLSVPIALCLCGFASAQGVAPDPSLMGADPVTAPADGSPAPQQQAPPAQSPLDDGAQEVERDPHAGFFFRLTLGLGWGFARGEGTLPPAKGLPRVDDFSHDSPVAGLSLSLGGGFLGLAIHAGLYYERMFMRSDEPIEMGITLMGVGGGLSYYFTDYDFFATVEVRFVGMMTFMPQVICEDYYPDKFEWYRGPGVSVTLGKEWYGEPDERGEEDESGIGVGVQGNWARLNHDGAKAFDYLSVLLVFTVSHF